MTRRAFVAVLAAALSLPRTANAGAASRRNGSHVVTLTAYCPCAICCGPWARYGLTAAQTIPVAGFTLASRQFPIGTIVRLDGQTHQVHDRGGPTATGFDVFFNTHDEARRFGVKRQRVQILHVPSGARPR